MTRSKSEIYLAMLHTATVWIRNLQTAPWWRRAMDPTCYQEAELVHELPKHLLGSEIDEADIWFLNHHARRYLEAPAARRSPNYSHQRNAIAELFALVPASMRSQLNWDGPAEHPRLPSTRITARE
jgi:hypothetical protein